MLGTVAIRKQCESSRGSVQLTVVSSRPIRLVRLNGEIRNHSGIRTDSLFLLVTTFSYLQVAVTAQAILRHCSAITPTLLRYCSGTAQALALVALVALVG